MMYPYKIEIVQSLLPQDDQKRLQYAICLTQLARHTDFLNNLVISDAAHFQLTGYVKKQN
nr:unnamed protein product [Callosobruchus chinensis]